VSDGEEWVTVSQAARRLAIAERTVRDWIHRGTLQAQRPPIGRGMLLTASGVETLARQIEAIPGRGPAPMPALDLAARLSMLEERVAKLEERLGRLLPPDGSG